MTEIRQYFVFFDQAQTFFRARRNEDAYIAFLKASRILYELARETDAIEVRAKWLERAERVRRLADNIRDQSGGNKGAAPTESLPPFHSNSSSIPSEQKSERVENASSKRQLTERPEIRFSDIAGLNEVKELITRRVIFPMRNRELASVYKRKIGAGIMMYGPPGTGKTMMAKAIAGELDAPFFSIQSSSIMSKWVGEAEQNFRDLFAEARQRTPAVLFFDESEALLAKRGGNSTVMNRVIPEFLAQVDGVAKGAEGLLLVGATNRPWDLDPAAVRPGRFGDKIYIPLPDDAAREFLLRQKLKDVPGADQLDYLEMARRTEGFSGADIDGLVNRIVDPVFDRAMETGAAVPLTAADVQVGLDAIKPSVSPQELKRYESYQNSGE